MRLRMTIGTLICGVVTASGLAIGSFIGIASLVAWGLAG